MFGDEYARALQAGASSTSAAGMVGKVENAAKNSKRITDWIKSISDLQKVRLLALKCHVHTSHLQRILEW